MGGGPRPEVPEAPVAVTRSAGVALTALAPGPAAVARSDVRLGAPPPSSAAYSGLLRAEREAARACVLLLVCSFPFSTPSAVAGERTGAKDGVSCRRRTLLFRRDHPSAHGGNCLAPLPRQDVIAHNCARGCLLWWRCHPRSQRGPPLLLQLGTK